MNCNCITDVTNRVAEMMKAEAGDDAKATCQVQGIVFASPSYTMISIPFRVRGSKRGYTSEKGKEITVVASYCPFCGVKATPDAAYQAGIATQGERQMVGHVRFKNNYVTDIVSKEINLHGEYDLVPRSS